MNSINQIEWKRRDIDLQRSLFFQKQGLSPVISNILSSKNHINQENYYDFVYPKIKNLFPDPFSFKDCEKICDIISNAINANQKIGFICDYDVDGSSCAGMIDIFLRYFDYTNFVIHIPNRITEGYGPTKYAVDKLHTLNCNLIISCDCGINAHDVIEYSDNLGISFCVIDHHQEDSEKRLPPASCVVNPNRIDDSSGMGILSAAGVLFFVLNVLNKKLEKTHGKKFEMLDLIAIVGISTVCDVMPMLGLNRAFYRRCMEGIKKDTHYGISILLRKMNVDVESINASTIGFKIGPVINAGGRLAENDSQYYGYHILRAINLDESVLQVCDDSIVANQTRKEIENKIIDSVIVTNEMLSNGFLIVYDKNWHEGVIGIIASRLKEKYNVPVFVGYENTHEEIKFSARSDSIDVGSVILKAFNEGIVLKGGGHSKAGGMSIHKSKIDDFLAILKNTDCKDISRVRLYDYNLSLSGVNLDLIDEIKLLEPFGNDNEMPVFVISDAFLENVVKKERHIVLYLSSVVNKKRFITSVFNIDYCDYLFSMMGQKISFVCYLNDRFYDNKRYVDMKIIDFIEK